VSERDSMMLIVTSCRAEALDVMSIELRSPQGGPLPPFEPGSHLEIEVPAEEDTPRILRQYSLSNSSSETHRYVIAVGRMDKGRGGSLAIHEQVRCGTRLKVRLPRNNFPIVTDALRYRFIAGGIGITPILSMIQWCEAHGKDWALLYCARNRPRAAFYERLLVYGDRVRFHFDDENRGGYLDLERELSESTKDEHVYCCGPQALMGAVQTACKGRPAASVHFEWFSAGDRLVNVEQAGSGAFEVVLRSTGERLQIDADKSILEVLEARGISVPFACREGLCGSCETRLCEGEADHRDFVLTEADREAQKSLMICVSRAKSEVLILDI